MRLRYQLERQPGAGTLWCGITNEVLFINIFGPFERILLIPDPAGVGTPRMSGYNIEFTTHSTRNTSNYICIKRGVSH